MLVTRVQLQKAGADCNNSWFDRRLVKHSDVLQNGRLLVQYDTENIEVQLGKYLKRLANLKHLRRHKSDDKCRSVFMAIQELVREQK